MPRPMNDTTKVAGGTDEQDEAEGSDEQSNGDGLPLWVETMVVTGILLLGGSVITGIDPTVLDAVVFAAGFAVIMYWTDE